jgi:hypothetical protein
MYEVSCIIEPREFANYLANLVQWDRPYYLVYRVTEAGEEYIGGYAAQGSSYWSTIQFQDDDPKLGSLTVVQDNGRVLDKPGYMPIVESPDPLNWVIDRSERQLKEAFEVLKDD